MRYTLDNGLQHVAQRLVNHTTTFESVQILDLAKTSVEVFVERSVYWLIHYGKNSHKILASHAKNLAWAQPTLSLIHISEPTRL